MTDTDATERAGGVREAAIELLSHLKLYVLDQLDDADMLRDRMYDLTAALSPPAAPDNRMPAASTADTDQGKKQDRERGQPQASPLPPRLLRGR